jgi:hypothetical protein
MAGQDDPKLGELRHGWQRRAFREVPLSMEKAGFSPAFFVCDVKSTRSAVMLPPSQWSRR